MNRNQKGDYCELLVIAALTKSGIETALPFGNQRGWDILVKENDVWQQWQIKSAGIRKGRSGIYVDLIRSNGYAKSTKDRYYHKGDFDYLVTIYPDTGEIWKYCADEVIERRSITMDNDHKMI